MKTAILDYGSGNLKSIENMLKYLEQEYFFVSEKTELNKADRLIFPGQGHFAQAMASIKEKELIEPVKHFIASEKPFLGICLGLQVLFESSEEAKGIAGLGIFQGEVLKFQKGKIPQIGWNKIAVTKANSILENQYYYFVNSYYVKPKNQDIVSSYCNYHIEFVSSVEKDNVYAVQFHPEKSSDEGIKVFKKWLKI